MAICKGQGQNRAIDAANAAISSPLLEISMQGAKRVLFNIAGGDDLTLSECAEAANIIVNVADEDALVIWGALKDTQLKDEIRITLIATDFTGARYPLHKKIIAPTGSSFDHQPASDNISISSITKRNLPKFEQNTQTYELDIDEIPAFIRQRK